MELCTNRPLAGRIALVTGGGTGIGLAIATELGDLGARIVIGARNIERLRSAAELLMNRGVEASCVQMNIRNDDEVRKTFEQLRKDRLCPDILINNAGGQYSAPALDISSNGFRSVVDLNLNGTWHMCRAFGAMRQSQGLSDASIINIVLSISGGLPGYAHAAAARSGVISLTQTLALEWAKFGVTVNAVAPGIIATDAIQQYDPQSIEHSVRALPIPRFGEPSEVAAAVAFLASPSARYITGTTLFVDGGRHLGRS